jgi:hypothetical protein
VGAPPRAALARASVPGQGLHHGGVRSRGPGPGRRPAGGRRRTGRTHDGAIGALALAANVACLLFLYRHRADDLNLRSTWLCSRNDIIANLAVLGAAGMVAVLDSGWPDVVVGGLIAALFLRSAAGVVRDARRELAQVA